MDGQFCMIFYGPFPQVSDEGRRSLQADLWFIPEHKVGVPGTKRQAHAARRLLSYSHRRVFLGIERLLFSACETGTIVEVNAVTPSMWKAGVSAGVRET